MRKSGNFRPDYIGKSLKSRFNIFIDGGSDKLLLVYLKISLKSKPVLSKMDIEIKHFRK